MSTVEHYHRIVWPAGTEMSVIADYLVSVSPPGSKVECQIVDGVATIKWVTPSDDDTTDNE